MEQFKKGELLTFGYTIEKIIRVGKKYYTTDLGHLVDKNTLCDRFDFRIQYHKTIPIELEKYRHYLSLKEMSSQQKETKTLISDLKAIKQLSKDVSIDKQELTERLEDIICWCEESIEDYNKEWNND